MRRLRLKFVDFWPDFSPEKNYFSNLLRRHYAVEVSDEPDLLIYSCYGHQYLNYDCVRVFYTAENVRPDFSACDFALSFDVLERPNHYRLPLYALYMDYPEAISALLSPKTTEQARHIWRSKKKFCCMVVSNPAAQKRIQFFRQLTSRKPVDSGGAVLNNVGGPVADKLAFIKDYRFVIAFENESYPGYTTEKVLEPLLRDCIPLYWGNPLVSRDFNPGCFLCYDDSKSEAQFIEEILAVDADEAKAVDLLTAPKFADNTLPLHVDKARVLAFFTKIVDALPGVTPVARTKMKYLHALRLTKRRCTRRAATMLRLIAQHASRRPRP